MAQIALHDYLEQINRFLEDEQPTEAITHCRHLLKQCPRHVDTYRLLARALLEHREFEDAGDLFQRILSAEPNDFVAHVGLSDIYRQTGKVAEALWHMERAYEMLPYDSALQEVMRELYMQRDGKKPETLPLTRAALARLYFKGELYQQAADELRSILGQNGDDRVDLQVLLAETLWRDNQRVDAVDVSLKVLEKLPDSLTVNAILAEIWLLTGRTEEAQSYLRHLHSLTQVDQKHLDPDSVVGHAFQADGAAALPEMISVERWRETADAEKLDAGTRVGTEQPIEDEAVYDWLRDASDTAELIAIPEMEEEEDEIDWFTDRLEMPPAQEESFAKTAEWLESMGVEPELGDNFDFAGETAGRAEDPLTQDEEFATIDDPLAWVDSETSITSEPIDVLPDWLSDLAQAGEDQAEANEDESDWFTSELGVEDESEESDWFMATLDEETPDAELLSTGDLLTGTTEADIGWLVENETLDETELVDEFVEEADDASDDWFTLALDEEAEAEVFDSELLDTGDLLSETESDFDWLIENESPAAEEFTYDNDQVDEAEDSDVSAWFTGGLDDDVTHETFDSELLDAGDLYAETEEADFDWLIENEPAVNELPGDEGEAKTIEDTLPDWLSELEDSPQAAAVTTEDDVVEESETVGTGDLFASKEPDWWTDDTNEDKDSGSLWQESDASEVNTDELFAGAMDSMPDWLAEEESQTEESSTGELRANLFDTNELFGDVDEDLPDWLEDESSSETTGGQAQSGLIRRMNRMMGTGDLFDEDDFPELDSDFEEPDNIPSGFTGLLIGTGDLVADDRGEEEDEPDMPSAKEESLGPTGGIAGLMGTAELLADMGMEIPDWLKEGNDASDDAEKPLLHTADLQGENLSEVPRWLFREEDDEQIESEQLEEPEIGDAGALGTAELFASLGEEVPDWIAGFSEDEHEDEEIFTSGASGIIGTDELLSELDEDVPDWIASRQANPLSVDRDDVSNEPDDEAHLDEWETTAEVEETPHTSKSLLDWLANQSVTSGESQSRDSNEDEWETVIMADNEDEFNMDEMPDDSDDLGWLDELSAEDDSLDKDKKKPAEGEKDISDWLSELTEPATESEAALADANDDFSLNLTDTDLPDWMKELGEASTSSSQSAISGSLENLPDWLKPPPEMEAGSSKSDDQRELEEALAGLPGADDGELDWLNEDAADETDALLNFAAEDSASKMDTSDVWLNELATEDGLEDEADLSFLDNASDGLGLNFDDGDAADLPDWLSLSETEGEAVLETADSALDDDLSDLFSEQIEDDEVGFMDLIDDLESAQAGDTFDWLSEITDDEEDFAEGVAAGLEEDELSGPIETAEFMAMFGDGDDEMAFETADEADDLLNMPIETAEFMAMFGDEDDDEIGLDTTAAEQEDDIDWLITSTSDEGVFDFESETAGAETGDDLLDLFGDPDTNLFAFDEADEDDPLADWSESLAEDEELVGATADADDLGLDLGDDDVSDWLTALAAEEPEADEPEAEGLPDWLTGTAGADTDELAEALADVDDQDSSDLFSEALDTSFAFEQMEEDEDAALADELPDWLVASAGSEAEMETADEVFAGLSDDYEESAEEEDEGLFPEFDMADDELDPMAWLDQLAEEQGEPVEDLPSILDTSMYDLNEAELSDLSADSSVEMPEDPEAAMAWLEALAEEQEADLEEEMPLPVDLATSLDPDVVNLLELEEVEMVGGESTDWFMAEDDDPLTAGDDESALSWLDALEEEEGDFTELPTLVEDMSDDLQADMDALPEDEGDMALAEMILADDEPALTWLDALEESDISLVDEMETDLADSEDSLEAVSVPDDLEEAMAWLDNLEAEDEDEESIEALPILADLILDEESEFEEVGETADDDEAEIDWLTALAEEQLEEDVAELPDIEIEPEPADPLQEALDRLEELALQSSASLAMDLPEPAESVETESLDDVLDWLEAQLAGPATDEMVDDSDSVADEVASLLDEAWTEEAVVVDAELADIAEDLVDEDEAELADMGEELWAETTLDFEPEADNSDELASMFGEMPEGEMSDDDILAFMDSIMDSEDSYVPEKDVSFTPDNPDAMPSFYKQPALEEIADVESSVVDIHDVDSGADESDELTGMFGEMPEGEMSDDDILAFMDSILDSEDSFVPEKDVSFTPDNPDAVPSFYTQAAVEEVVDVESPALEIGDADLDADESDGLTGMFGEMPEGEMSDDDILAFMDSILDSADSFVPEKGVSFTPDDPNAVPSFAVTGAVDSPIKEPTSAEMDELPDDSDDAIAWLTDLADAQEDDEENMPINSLDDLDRFLPEVDEDFAVGMFADVSEGAMADDSLPDWLEFDVEDRMPGHTDWLRSLPEPDVAGWLEAEEEVMSASIFDEIPVPLEPERPSVYNPSFVSPEPEPEEYEDEIEEKEEISTSILTMSEGALDKARHAMAQGNYDVAMAQYRNMIEEGQGLSALITDLESATEEHAQQPRLRRILGDAYMRNGQLQRALEVYRVALDEL